MSKRLTAYLVLWVLISQNISTASFAYDITHSWESDGAKTSISNYIHPEDENIISDEASLSIISDEVDIQDTLTKDENTSVTTKVSPNTVQKVPSLHKKKSQNQPNTDKVIIKYKSWRSGIGKAVAQNSFNKKADSSIKIENLDSLDLWVVSFDEPQSDIQTRAQELEKLPHVIYAEPDYKRSSFTISWVETNDPRSDELWHLKSIQADEAWKIYDDSEHSTLVSVNDSGIDYTHNDLVDNLKDLSSSCQSSSGTTISGGCPNFGRNFEDGYSIGFDEDETYDISGHGTLIHGIIWASRDNNTGISWVTENVELMSARTDSYSAFDETFYLSDTIRAIDFAIQNNAKVINLSYGWSFFSQAEFDAIERAKNNDILVVVAAGNSTNDNDINPIYPASYDLNNIISVAALSIDDTLSSYSNYWASSVDIAAPWGDIVDFTTGSGWILSTAPFQETVFFEWFETASWFTESWTGSDWYVYDGDFWILTQDALHYSGSVDSTILLNQAFSLSGATLGTFEWTISCDFWSGGTFDSDFGDGLNMYLHDQDTGIDSLLSNVVSSFIGGSWNRFKIPITQNSLLKDNLQIKIQFYTDSDDDVGKGCYLDDLEMKSHQRDASVYRYTQWTSFSAPIVAWVAAMLWSYNPDLDYRDIKNSILLSTDNIWLQGQLASWWKINADKALKKLIQKHGITKSGTIGDNIRITADLIQLSSGKNLTLSWGSIYVDEYFSWTNSLGSGATVSGTGTIMMYGNQDLVVHGSTIISNTEDIFITLSDASGTTINRIPWSYPEETLRWDGIFLNYSWSIVSENLMIQVRGDQSGKTVDLYNGPLESSIFIPIKNGFSGIVSYKIYTSWEWKAQISDGITIDLYEDFDLVRFISSNRHFLISPDSQETEVGKDVGFVLEAIDYDGNRLRNYSWSIVFETDIPGQTQFTNEALEAYTFPQPNLWAQGFNNVLQFSQVWSHELRVYDTNDSSFTGSSVINIIESIIPIWELSVVWESITNTRNITVGISSSGYPVSYTISWDTSQSYTGSLNASWFLDIELSETDGQKNITLTLVDADQDTGQTTTKVTLDETAPLVSINSHADGEQVEWDSITLSGNIQDDHTIASLVIEGDAIEILSDSWNTNITLSWGLNTLEYITHDIIGNTYSGSLDIIRWVKAENISHSSIDSNSASINFDTDFWATWEILYGISPNKLDTSISTELGTEHTALLSNLESSSTYYYKVRWLHGDYTGAMSSVQTFTTSTAVIATVTTSSWGGWWGSSSRSVLRCTSSQLSCKLIPGSKSSFQYYKNDGVSCNWWDLWKMCEWKVHEKVEKAVTITPSKESAGTPKTSTKKLTTILSERKASLEKYIDSKTKTTWFTEVLAIDAGKEKQKISQVAQTISNRELIYIFQKGKKSLKEFPKSKKDNSTDGTSLDYSDFINSWNDLSIWYSEKTIEEKQIQKEKFLSIYISLEKERLAWEKHKNISIQKISGNEIVYVKYQNKQIAKIQILLFSYIRKNNGTNEDYQSVHEVLSKLQEYIENKDLSSEEKAKLKTEIQATYQEFIWRVQTNNVRNQ